MVDRFRPFAAPAYLVACLILGGSAQGVWQNMILQLAGIVILAWAAVATTENELTQPARQLLVLGLVVLAFVVLQLVPLPRMLWATGPRAAIGADFAAVAIPLPGMSLSVVPAATLTSLLGAIPPLALFCAIVRLKAHRPVWLATAVIGATILSIALGALQVTSTTANTADSPSTWYLFADTTLGRAVGFFANPDHFGTLLLASIPFLVAVPAAAKKASFQRYSALVAISIGIGILVVVGIALNGSLAGYGLVLPVTAASALILLPNGSKLRLWVVAATLLLVIAGVGALEYTSIGSGELGNHADSAVQSRTEILRTTMTAIRDFLPFGSGLGSFKSVYPLYEQGQTVETVYVVHAHNDYAEWVLELGVVGLVVMLLFLAWWGLAVWRVWRTAEATPFARAATIASAAVLVHSFVDFPLRTAAVAALFSMCLALLADGKAPPVRERNQVRRRRHVEFR